MYEKPYLLEQLDYIIFNKAFHDDFREQTLSYQWKVSISTFKYFFYHNLSIMRLKRIAGLSSRFQQCRLCISTGDQTVQPCRPTFTTRVNAMQSNMKNQFTIINQTSNANSQKLFQCHCATAIQLHITKSNPMPKANSNDNTNSND